MLRQDTQIHGSGGRSRDIEMENFVLNEMYMNADIEEQRQLICIFDG